MPHCKSPHKPLAFDIFPSNQNEQTTLEPLESKILQDFNCSDFIDCSDSGQGYKTDKSEVRVI